MYLNRWPKEKPHWSRKAPSKELPKQLQTHNVPAYDVKIPAQIEEEIYDLLTSCGLFPEEQKGSCKWTRYTWELLYIDHHILNEMKKSSYGVDWLQKVYDMVPQNCLKIDKISDEKTMETRRAELTAGGKILAE